MKNPAASNRIFYFDFLETISIFLVCFCHYTVLGNTFWDNAFMTLCYIAVPIFFMINGALTLTRKTFQLKKHLLRTLQRYLIADIWRIIYLFWAVYKTREVLPDSLSKTDIFNYIFFWTDIPGCAPGHMWFMKALLAINIITPLIYYGLFYPRFNKALTAFICSVLLVPFIVQDSSVLLGLLQNNGFINSSFSLAPVTGFSPFGNAGDMLLFYIIGAWIYHSSESICRKNSSCFRWMALFSFVACWFLMLLTKRITSGAWIWNGTYFNNGYTRLSTAAASASLFILFMLLDNRKKGFSLPRKFVELISQNTLGIFYIHWIAGGIIYTLFPSGSLFYNMLKSLLVLLLSFAASYGISKIPLINKLVH